MTRARSVVAAPPTRSGGRTGTFLAILVGFGLSLTFFPTTLLVAVGMVPVFAAFIFDRDPRRSLTLTVALMDVAGLVLPCIQLWHGGQTLDRSVALIEEPLTWLIVYGAAAAGWLIFFSVLPVVHLVLAQHVKSHIAELERRQAELRRVWGEDVRPTPASP